MLYLVLAVWGAVHPVFYFVTYMRQSGTGVSGMIDAWYVNASTTGLVWDLTIASIALTIWAIAETSVRKTGPLCWRFRRRGELALLWSSTLSVFTHPRGRLA